MKNRRLAFFLLSVFSTVLVNTNVLACTCSDMDVKQRFKHTDVAFAGKVLSKKKDDKEGVEVVFQIEKVWKGKVMKMITIHTGPTEDLYDVFNMCAPLFRVGERYVVFAGGKKTLSNDVCQGFWKFSDAEKMIGQLGKGQVPKEKD